MKLESVPQVLTFDPFTNDTGTSNTENLGEAVYVADGRIFRYGKAGGTIAAGSVACGPAPIANHQNMACTVSAIGVFIVNVTPSSTGGNAGIYNEGYLIINDNTGEGISYKVSTHPAITASTAFNVTLFDPIQVALDATSVACLIHNTYNLPTTTTTQTLRPAGVPLVATAVNNYCWFQTRGYAAVLCDTTGTVNTPGVVSGSVAGAVVTQSSTFATDYAKSVVGRFIVAGADTEERPFWIEID